MVIELDKMRRNDRNNDTILILLISILPKGSVIYDFSKIGIIFVGWKDNKRTTIYI
jgi:hypothetical protein